MTPWILVVLLSAAGMLALALLWPRWREGPATPRMLAEVVVTTGVVFAISCGVLLVFIQRLLG